MHLLDGELGKCTVSRQDIMEIAAVCNLEKEIQHMVAKEVEPRKRPLLGIDEPVSNDLIKSNKEG